MTPHEHPALHADRITRETRTPAEVLTDHLAWHSTRIDDWKQRELPLKGEQA